MKIIAYVLVWKETNTELNTSMEYYLAQGYQPYGFPYAVHGRTGTYQAVVKYEETESR